MADEVRAIPRAIQDAAGDWLARRQEPASPDVERAFAVWLDADPRHRIAYAQAERHWQDSSLLADRDVGRTRKLVRAPFLMRHSTHVAAASLGVVVLLGIGGVGLLRYGSPLELVSPAQAATYETALGEIRTISLADGSQLTLDTATRVRVTLSASERKVSLERGRARFRVAPDGKRPFTVTVSGGTVVARSTLFDVSVERGSPVVAVIEGRVDLTTTSDAASHPARTLAAGQTADLGNAGTPRPTQAGETQWVSGMLALDGGPLGEAVAAINRYNRIQIRLADPELARLSVTGAFQMRNPDAFARAVAATFGLGIDRTDPGVILLRRAP
ncbi:FecR domain-containing protein [Novosphingobium sp. BW1]|uniref:FecR family protein n=1 Tax=Novosphingobium sp. BW1 TaxID=2592621 RepID=UPI0011DE8DC2|nr:FecR domain-containing protein [Novosphingobium sp. BW1]TYC86338.1 DUF4880 domain-containing protein [Novosphingobium sp. BW1]